jgi:hypothetical protein
MIVPGRFNGPPASGHGGVSCGIFAAAIDPRAATVRLLRPPPLDTPLITTEVDGVVTVSADDDPVATVRSIRGDFAVGEIPWLDEADIRGASAQWVKHTQPDHPFPTCFGCGHLRPAGDGLRLFAGEVDGTDLSATYWTPAAELAGSDGRVPDWLVWAALDCPSGAVTFRHFPRGTPIVLGELTVRIDASPVVGERYEVVSRTLGIDGRRMPSEVALIAADGRRLAGGRATWFALTAGS